MGDVIFVHGLGEDVIDAWSIGSIYWPRNLGLLPIDLQNVRILTWVNKLEVADVPSFRSDFIVLNPVEETLSDAVHQRKGQEQVILPPCFANLSVLLADSSQIFKRSRVVRCERTRPIALFGRFLAWADWQSSM